MNSDPRKQPSSSGRKPLKKPLPSRISSLFGGKSGHVNSTSIELDEQLRLYGPGETVKGKLVLDVAKPLGVTHIVLCLYGYSQVFKNYNSPRPGVRNSSGRMVTSRDRRWVTEYYGDGFATLFEKEVVLCGEGRLDPKLYHFRFEIDFPNDLTLPSSIDFEKGTVSYLVIATITRPTSINPTSMCEHRVAFRQCIDVATLSDPKPRVVTLEPLGPNGKSKSSLKRLTSYDGSRRSHLSARSKKDRSHKTGNSNSNSSRAEDASPRPNSPSVKSSRSNSTCDQSMSASITGAETGSVVSNQSAKEVDMDNGKITASVKLSRTGYLPGETVTVKVQVQHAKVVQAVDGIIVTLYRQARVDMHPVVPGQKKSEDYYPRSKTGLGGLSLSTAGSSQTWRKDLSQTAAPLYIDPRTLSAEVRVAVAVPDEAFPSIRNVPGDMISFNYYVEVIIDIHGKLSSSHGNFPNLDITAPQKSYGRTDMLKQPVDLNSSSPTLYGTNCIDTTQKRRDKNTITLQCDLVVGTNDSEKSRGKRRAVDAPGNWQGVASNNAQVVAASQNDMGNGAHHEDLGGSPRHGDRIQAEVEQWRDRNWLQRGYYENGQDDFNNIDEYNNYDYDDEYAYGYDYGYGYGYGNDYEDPYYSNEVTREPVGMATVAHPPYFRPPHLVEEQEELEEMNLTEKERLRRAEARLLPSAPPIEDPAQSGGTNSVPSAPFLPNEHDYGSNMAYREAVARHYETLSPLSVGDLPNLGRLATSTSTIRPSTESHQGEHEDDKDEEDEEEEAAAAEQEEEEEGEVGKAIDRSDWPLEAHSRDRNPTSVNLAMQHNNNNNNPIPGPRPRGAQQEIVGEDSEDAEEGTRQIRQSPPPLRAGTTETNTFSSEGEGYKRQSEVLPKYEL